ncbi:GFA family protein [Oceanicola sp. S124]|uniref:GFA family protein n=1 Tax=Oceanicola sp. S124 TaxID=1042378 RepID=UPI00025585C8|nr:GFA family protein [Oceanicola sp. S124]
MTSPRPLPSPETPLTGTCRCGAVTLTVTAPPIMTAACHCTGCQSMSASAFSLTMMVPLGALEVDGETTLGGARSPDLDHHCCPACHGWLYSRPAGMPFINIRPTLFDDPRWADPFIETMGAERQPWATTPAPHSYEGFPPPEDFPALLEAFAATRL